MLTVYTCTQFKEYVGFFALNQQINDVSFDNHALNAVLYNYRIVDYNTYKFKWDRLLFLEAFYIKRLKPDLNYGIKASKEFVLFT